MKCPSSGRSGWCLERGTVGVRSSEFSGARNRSVMVGESQLKLFCVVKVGESSRGGNFCNDGCCDFCDESSCGFCGESSFGFQRCLSDAAYFFCWHHGPGSTSTHCVVNSSRNRDTRFAGTTKMAPDTKARRWHPNKLNNLTRRGVARWHPTTDN